MKEIAQKQQDKTEITKQAKKDIQRILVGSTKPKRNHTVFEINLTEKTIEKVKFERNTIIYFSDALQQKTENKSISIKENCIYVSALNKKNAFKILKRDFKIEF
jgi:tRNA pseudouridine-54 N-methylase